MFQLSLIKNADEGYKLVHVRKIGAVLYGCVKYIHVIDMDFFLFSGFNRFMHFYVNPCL
jgi:hypothetical protein